MKRTSVVKPDGLPLLTGRPPSPLLHQMSPPPPCPTPPFFDHSLGGRLREGLLVDLFEQPNRSRRQPVIFDEAQDPQIVAVVRLR